MQEKYRLEMNHITKCFGGVQALKDVNLKIKDGEIHALVGENGAGKSTLMKILSGAYSKDEGEIVLNGKLVSYNTAKEAKNLGIAVIYQEFMLAPDLTVAENIFIDRLSAGKKLINWKELKRQAKIQLEKLGFGEINPGVLVGSLSVAYQQVIEICKCLTRNAQILVLDEPTAVLTFTEIEKLFGVIRKLKAEGTSIIYISHRLEEIFQLSDTITILKDGTYIDTLVTNQTNKEELVYKMVGRELTQLFPKREAVIGEEILRVENLSVGNAVRNVNFHVCAGEILGFAGLVGSGRTETLRAIFGADRKDAGEITYCGKQVDFKSPKEAIAHGLGLLPEDRKGQGLLLEQSIRINATLTALSKVKNKLGFINHKREKEIVFKLLESIATKYGSMEDDANSLSGGNQQKIALAKWVFADCKCIIFDEPTRGVDVGAKTEIYKIMKELTEQGVAIIMISSEMPEIIGMCDRTMIMCQGKISGELQKSELEENSLIKYAMGI